MTDSKRAMHRSKIRPEDPDSPQRRQDILRAAADLFSKRGYDGVSLRSIAEQANVPVGLCTYYFGRKSNLYSCLFEHGRNGIEQRIHLLNEIRDGAESYTVRDLVSGWISPVFQLLETGGDERFAILIARAIWDSADASRNAVEEFYDPVAHAFIEALTALLPDCERSDIIWGYQWALGAMLMHLADERIVRLSAGEAKARDSNKMDLLIGFITAGLSSLPRKPKP